MSALVFGRQGPGVEILSPRPKFPSYIPIMRPNSPEHGVGSAGPAKFLHSADKPLKKLRRPCLSTARVTPTVIFEIVHRHADFQFGGESS